MSLCRVCSMVVLDAMLHKILWYFCALFVSTREILEDVMVWQGRPEGKEGKEADGKENLDGEGASDHPKAVQVLPPGPPLELGTALACRCPHDFCCRVGYPHGAHPQSKCMARCWTPGAQTCVD